MMKKDIFKKVLKYLCPVLTTLFGILFIVLFIPSSKKVYNERFFVDIDPTTINKVKVVEIVDKFTDKTYFGDEVYFLYISLYSQKSEELEKGSEILVVQSITELEENKYISAKLEIPFMLARLLNGV